MAKDQQNLPGLEEREIQELEDKAYEYKKIRDKRQDLTRREVEFKTDLLVLMKKYKKRDYDHDGVEIHVVTEQETVKVTIHEESEPEVEK